MEHVVSPILKKAEEKVIDKLMDKAVEMVIDKLLNAVTYLRDQYYWKTNLEEDLQSLTRLFPQIQAVVGVAEHRLTPYESSNPSLIKCLRQFKNGIGEAEEVLDDLEYLEQERKANSDKSWLSKSLDASIKAGKRLLKFDDVLERLKTCVKNLNTSASDVANFLKLLMTQTGGIATGQTQQEILPLSYIQSRITSSLPVLSFIGREEEKGKIIRYLLGEESEIQISQNVNCLPLVAMGGMGKTALAQQVFDHFENAKKEHFHIKIWVCVSTDLDASSLMKKILEYSTGRSESEPLERLPVKLREELDSKRFLLVLDDAWDDKNQTEWEKLCVPLLYGQKGSWILLTTRLKSVAKMVSKVIRGGTMEPMTLRGLSNDECHSLLYEHAFARQDPNGFPQLKKIGEKIVEKLDGVPLLAKSIGGALNSKVKEDHWTSISKSEVWKMSQDLNYEFIPALTLSYKMLPPCLKRCFSYCGIFPQNYQFNKQKLVCMWVAAGLIYSDESEEGSDEDIANRWFDMLCDKSFFDVHTYNRSPFWESTYFCDTEEDFYTMHNMLNGLARHVSRNECCRIEHDAPSCNLDHDAIRHISITSTDAELHGLVEMVCKLKHLRTLWIQHDGHPQKLDDFIRDACKSPRRIRVLIIKLDYSRSYYQYWKSISDFAKLRFLEMSGFWLPPPSLSKCKFYFLQVLIGNKKIVIMAEDANKLINLRHLYGVQEDVLFSVPKVGKLTSLQELCFTVGTDGYRIDELMNMANLRQLSIAKLSNVQSLEEANKINLVGKHHLTRLRLGWDEASSNPDHDQREVLAALEPSSTIRELFITHYKGSRLAQWMDNSSLSCLEYLQLSSCTNLEELSPLWKLPFLKFLKLCDMEALISLGCHFSGQIDIQFPVLEELEFRNLPLWEEWNGADDYIWFPHLKSFLIKNCPKLKKIPYLPLSIENLKMEYLGLEALPRSYNYLCSNRSRTLGGFQQLMSLKSLKIYKCLGIVLIGSIGKEDDHLLPSSLKILELENTDEHKDLGSYLRGLTLLTTLHLHCSRGLESLPSASELKHLTTLQDVSISDAEALTSPGGLYILKSLKSLKIYDCPKFLSAEVESREIILPSSLKYLKVEVSDISQKLLGRCFQGLTSLKWLNVSHCQHLESLPNIVHLHNLTALQTLHISDCKELCELESLTVLVSLRELYIACCPKLQNLATTTEQSRTLTSLKSIIIDSIFYLPILPIPKGLQTLSIQNKTDNPPMSLEFTSEIKKWLWQCQESLEVLELKRMPLQSLPISLEKFSLLKILRIFYTPELKLLPKMPTSLKLLEISGCSAKLKKHCQENICRDWPNINYIEIPEGDL